MIEGLRPYPELVMPELDWLPALPSHWQLHRAKSNFREVDERSVSGGEELLSVSHKTGVTPRSQKNVTMFMAESYEGHKTCKPGDIVVNTLWAWMAALGASKHVGIVSPAYGVYRQRRGAFDARFLDYLLRTEAYRGEYYRSSRGITTSRLRLYPPDFLNIPIVQPPLAEQRLIVRFLDWHGAMTGRLIRSKQRLIALLKEQKQAIIHQAVTRGLNPHVELRRSGVQWLGDVPRHWEVKRLKNVADVILGKMLTPISKGEDQLKPYLRSANVQWGKPDVRSVHEMWIGNDEADQLLVRTGDLLITEGGEVGRACIWKDELPECYIQNSVHRVVVRPGVLSEFLLLLFICDGKRGRFEAAANRVSIAHLTREKLVAIPFAFPPPEEQSLICDWVDEATKPLMKTIAQTQSEITLIREFRDRLTADVVTGQIDVRAVAAKVEKVDEAETQFDIQDEGDDEGIYSLTEEEEDA